MVFQGVQKLTLLDFPGRVACTLFTGGCNLRCPFCHNAGIVRTPDPKGMSEAQVYAFLGTRIGVLDGVCVTGGEPLLWAADLEEFFRSVKEMGFATKLDTNGCYPGPLRRLIDQKLVDYVAMDIKNSPERYAETTGIPDLDLGPVRESVSMLLEGRVDYEFRTTVVRQFHDEQSLLSAAEWIRGAKRYALQKFTDSGALMTEGLSGWDDDTMRHLADAVRTVIPHTQLRGL